MYLLDTNVVSELRHISTGRCDARVAQWQASVRPAVCYLSMVTWMELEIGVRRMERRDAVQGRSLRQWLSQSVATSFFDRILDIDVRIATEAARLQMPDPRPPNDALIAATAWVHGLTVVTRNVADFAPMGVSLLNPWQPHSVQEPARRP